MEVESGTSGTGLADRSALDVGASGVGLLPRTWRPASAPRIRTVSGARARREAERRDAIFRRSLAVADVAAAAGALMLCASIGDDRTRAYTLLALPLVVLAGKLKGLYDRDELLIHKTTLDQAPQLFGLATLYVLVIWLLDGWLLDGELTRTQVVVLWGSLFILVLLLRRLSRFVARRLTATERCLFIGSDSSFERLYNKLSAHGDSVALVGRMSLKQGLALEGVRDPNSETLEQLIDDLNVHRIIVEPSEPSPQLTLDFVREAKSTGVRVSLLPRILEVVGSSIEIDDVDGLTLLGVRRFGLSRSEHLLKRTFDLCGSALGLLALAPVFAVVAIRVKLDSPGPVFFKQTRIGRHGTPFVMWKFRTMQVGADERKSELRGRNEAIGLFKIAEDPRVTRVGRRLRAASLDELPQLVNVLRGEMSLVGPRPLVSDEDEQIIGDDRRRLELTPGMTGHWQILGSARIPLPEMVKLDYLYVAGWSLWNDAKILLRTGSYVVTGRGQ